MKTIFKNNTEMLCAMMLVGITVGSVLSHLLNLQVGVNFYE